MAWGLGGHLGGESPGPEGGQSGASLGGRPTSSSRGPPAPSCALAPGPLNGFLREWEQTGNEEMRCRLINHYEGARQRLPGEKPQMPRQAAGGRAGVSPGVEGRAGLPRVTGAGAGRGLSPLQPPLSSLHTDLSRFSILLHVRPVVLPKAVSCQGRPLAPCPLVQLVLARAVQVGSDTSPDGKKEKIPTALCPVKK